MRREDHQAPSTSLLRGDSKGTSRAASIFAVLDVLCAIRLCVAAGFFGVLEGAEGWRRRVRAVEAIDESAGSREMVSGGGRTQEEEVEELQVEEATESAPTFRVQHSMPY